MTIPVQLSDLDLAVTAADADLALIRKSNTTDYKVTCQVLRNINIAGLPDLTPTANTPALLDLMLVQRAGTNSKCYYGATGFLKGTQMWFFQDNVPNGTSPVFWKLISGFGGNLLAVRGGATYTVGGAAAGTWQQTGVGLTAAQNGPHFHIIEQGKEVADNSTGAIPTLPRLGKTIATIPNAPKAQTNSSGTGALHNHGNTWRPLASVGILCSKEM